MAIELKHSATNIAAIEKKFSPYFEAAEDAWKASIAIIPEAGPLGKGVEPNLRLCMVAAFTKVIRLSLGCINLAREGLALEAQVLCRTIFETYLQMKFVDHSENREGVASEWLAWDIANKAEQLKKLVGRYPELGDTYRKAKENVADLRREMNRAEWDEFLWKGPSRRKVWSLCKHIDELEGEVAMQGTYKSLYVQTSGQAHGFDLTDYSQRIGPTDINVLLSPSPQRLHEVVVSAMILTMNAAKIANNHLKLGQDKPLDEAGVKMTHAVGRFRKREDEESATAGSS